MMVVVAIVESGEKNKGTNTSAAKLNSEIYCTMKRGFQFVWSKNRIKVF
jgi:hypothetical protein